MRLHDLLDSPRVYDLKTMVLSLGRRSVLEYLETFARLRPCARVLDAGCGTGRHARAFASGYTGIDANMRYLIHARRRGCGTFALNDAAHLAFASNTFDFAFCAGLCHHLPDDQVLAVLAELKRVTIPRGRILVIDAVLPSKRNIFGRLLLEIDRGAHIRSLEALTQLTAQEDFHLLTPRIRNGYPYRRAAFCHERGER